MEIMEIVFLILNSISIVYCSVIIIIYKITKELHSFPLELSTYLICFIGMFNVSGVLYNDRRGTLCTIQAIVSTYFELGSSLWTTIIGFMSFKSIVNSNYVIDNTNKLRVFFLCFTIILPLVFVSISLSLNVFDKVEEHHSCEISFLTSKGEYEIKGIIMCMIYYSMTWLATCYNIYFITCLISNIRKARIDSVKINKYITKLIWYPIIQILNYVPSTITIVIDLVNRNHTTTPKYLLIFETFVDCLCGIMYCVVFGFNKRIMEYFRKCCCLCFRKKPYEEEIENEINMDMPKQLSQKDTYKSDYSDEDISDNSNDSKS